MSCLALSLQPVNGSDILLQTREWFPPARALVALSAFRQTRLAFAAGKHQPGEEMDASAALGDDPLAASSGQVIVGVESKYRVVYRLVNGIYVLGITTVDQDNAVNNVFECISIVNQGVSVVVAACRGVDVTPEKLSRKYAEVYMALDIVLRGKIRFVGDITGAVLRFIRLSMKAGIEAFSNARFELPAETLAAGDEFAVTLAPAVNEQEQLQEKEEESSDPFAASDSLNKPEELVEATKPTHISVEGFEGDYGGIEFVKKAAGLSGLELLQTGPDAAPASTPSGTAAPLDSLVVKQTEMKGPEMYISEVINAEFRESLLARTGLMGIVYLRTLPKKTAGDKETEFSFRVDGTGGVKRFVMNNSSVSSVGNGMFHVRTAPSDEPIPILKYSLLPRLTPLPLRVRLIKRQSGTLLSVMIQYASNPDLLTPLTDVTFILKLPVDPTLLNVTPKAVLSRSDKELRWHVPEIPLKGTPGKLKARMPVDSSADNDADDFEVVVYVKFS
ncbi:unnamed protein product [Rhodiola kirilowii]